jgi:hypothetical protein
MMHAENLENEFCASFVNCEQNEGGREGCGGEERGGECGGNKRGRSLMISRLVHCD